MYTPIDTFWKVIKGKYKSKILIYLSDRSLRYTKIRKKFSEASERILIKQLKELERDGLIEKKFLASNLRCIQNTVFLPMEKVFARS
jgi:DNA-binding HxlR family transcriptional regulator